MPRGYPDYGNPNYQIAGTQVNLGDLILAATGFQTLDGLGRLIWFDTFRNGLGAWDNGVTGDAVAPVLYTQTVEIPPASIRMNVGTTTGLGSVEMNWYGVSTPSDRCGIELAFDFDSTDQRLEAYLWRPDPDKVTYGRFRVRQSTGDLDIYTGGGWQNIHTISGLSTYQNYQAIKMVCDFETGYYARLISGDQLFDISAYPLPTLVSPVTKRLWAQLYGYPETAVAAYAKIGHVAITIDEP